MAVDAKPGAAATYRREPHQSEPHRSEPSQAEAAAPGTDARARQSVPVPQCPIRPGEPCTLCQLDVTGPADCGLVYLVMHDPELREQWLANRRARTIAGHPATG